jgi:hypothetical protein
MFKLLVVYAHLLGTCLAIGMIALTDARLVAKVVGYKVVIPPPSRFETRAIAIALLLLLASGGALIAIGLAERPDYLANAKLQAKLLLVGLLCANAVVLHRRVFPSLERRTPVRHWTPRQCNVVAASVALSNGLWLYCAFLGIARPWNHTVSFATVLAIAVGVWLVMFCLVRFVLTLAGRDETADADWIDSLKISLSGFGDLPPTTGSPAEVPPLGARARLLPERLQQRPRVGA